MTGIVNLIKKIIPMSWEASSLLEQLPVITIHRATDKVLAFSKSLPEKREYIKKAVQVEYAEVKEAAAKEPAAKEPEGKPISLLQSILSVFNPEVSLMGRLQWPSHLHNFITKEYVYVGETKATPFYRKRKQIQEALQSIEKRGGDIDNFKYDMLVREYLVWRLDVQLFVSSDDTLTSFPSLDTWRADVPIFHIHTKTMAITPININSVAEFVTEWPGNVSWPCIDGKKTDLISELGAGPELDKLTKADLAPMVGKKRVEAMINRWRKLM